MISAKSIKLAAKLGFPAIALGAACMGVASHAQGGGPEVAAQEAPAPSGASAGNTDNGKTLFENNACGACHGLADAGTAGGVGPMLDKNPNLTREFIISRVANGAGPMPGFAGQLSDQEMADIAAYILKVAEK